MLRTTSSATLLLTAAAAAVTAATASGCVSVHAPPAPAVPTPSATAPAPRPEGHADDRPLVQGPAREALQRSEPSPHRSPAAQRPAEPPRAPVRRAVPAPRKAPDTVAPPHTRAPRIERPAVPAPPKTDVCALGRQYGGWSPDSPQATICKDTYGS
ncbi:hypothetical protein ABT127_36875 [Streptomyces sp. NPDC001904]|uniref:hypothetical protein n=1 Tax=Streptomyces sp. NPDC001904 TaxID=3154531 RepID=UPI00331E5A08